MPTDPAPPQTTCYHSYLLRLWRNDNDEPCLRIVLERVGDGQRATFASFEEMNAFLIAETETDIPTT